MKPKLFHIKDNFRPGAVTLAVEPHEDGTFSFGLAICSPSDQFNRKIGRLMATGRLRKRPIKAPNFDGLAMRVKSAIRNAMGMHGFRYDGTRLARMADERLEKAKEKALAKNDQR